MGKFSRNKVRDMIESYYRIRQEIKYLELELNNMNYNIVAELKKDSKFKKLTRINISGWDCESKDNPINLCIEDADDYEESCIFCGEPHERK